MPKAKPSTQRKAKPKPAAKKKTASRPARTKPAYSAEYRDYLQRYKIAGEERPLLDPKEFDQLDDEYLDLLAADLEFGLDDEQTIRLRELEYLLLESEE